MTAARLLPDPAATNRKAIEGLDIAVTALALHCDNKFTAVKAVKQSPYSAKGGTWTATSSVAEPAAPEPCTSPRIGAVPAAAGLAALQRQHSTPCKTIAASTHSVRTKAAVQPLRKSADAIPTRKTSKTVTASPLRQSRRQSSLSRSGGSTNLSPEEARIAAIRRSRMRVEKIGINHDSAHERRRHEIYALNAIMRASEEAKLLMLIKQHAEGSMPPDAAEAERMSVLATQPDSDDDRHDHSHTKCSPASSHAGSLHKV